MKDSISPLGTQVFDVLTNSAEHSKNDNVWSTLFSALVSTPSRNPLYQVNSVSSAVNIPVVNIKGLSPTGRNMALSDPESAYKMMSLINHLDVYYKAQFSELDQMKTAVSQMRDAGESLGSMNASTGNDSIKLRLMGFVGQYNSWIRRFNSSLQQGGLLAGTQAAQVSRYELEQNLKSTFFGANDGVRGMDDLGITIDPFTHLATLDKAKLDTMLANNRLGVVNTVQEFSNHFARSAGLLVSKGNFIERQQDNLNRAIHYIADNKDALQLEFGTGDAAKPDGQLVQALQAYRTVAN